MIHIPFYQMELFNVAGGVPRWPVQSDGAEAEHSDGAVELLEELDSLAHNQSVKPPAAAGADPERDVEGNARQARADPRARQVLDEAAGDRFKDARGAAAPQHGTIAWGGEARGYSMITAAVTGELISII